MDYQEFKTASGQKLWMFDLDENTSDEECMKLIARIKKIKLSDLAAMNVWIKEDHGYIMSTEQQNGARMVLAVTKESIWKKILKKMKLGGR